MARAADPSLQEDLNTAAVELTYFNFDVAYDLYKKLQSDVADSTAEHWQQVTFGLALAAQNRTPPSAELIDEATSLFEEILTKAPESKFAPRAKMNLGRIAEVRDYGGDEIELDTARVIYRSVLEHPQWSKTDIADEAALRYADTYVQNFEDPAAIREGVSFLEEWIKGRPDASAAPVIWEYLGNTKLVMLHDFAGAVEALVKADELGLVEQSQAGETYWVIATVAQHENDDLDTAIKYYQKIITDTPRSGKAFESQLALRELAEKHPQRNIEVPEVPQLLGGSFSPEEDAAMQKDSGEGE